MYQKNRNITKSLQAFCLLLVVTLSLMLVSCGSKDASSTPASGSTPSSSSESSIYEDGATIGEGSTEFTLIVENTEDERTFTVLTDAENVGDALTESGVASGEVGEYGLFIDTVNGTTVNYDEDQAYWAFYVNGEYATVGVSETPVEAGAEYALRVES